MSATAEQAAALGRDAAAPGSAVLVGLLGRGIQSSRSPAMHEAEGRRQGLSYVYTLLDTDRMGPNPPSLGELLRFAEHLGYCGLNVTYPYKQEVLAHLSALSDNAEAIGSVNTVVLRNGRRVGHNTDLWGFAESFRIGMADAPRDTVLLLGAGGAGGAVARALLEAGVSRLLIKDIDENRAQSLTARLATSWGSERATTASDDAGAASVADGVVNATPVGMASHPGTPIPLQLLRPEMWVADIIYFPLETELLRAARSLGCRTMDGTGMAVFQAARAFEHFTGLAPDVDKMHADFAAPKRPPVRG